MLVGVMYLVKYPSYPMLRSISVEKERLGEIEIAKARSGCEESL